MSSGNFADIAVIGGGASGMISALTARKYAPKARIVILERLAKTGKKLLATGNGKCNLSNKNISADSYHGSVKNVMDIIGKTGDTCELFQSMGVMCIADSQGRIYPHSESSASVVGALRMALAEADIEEICNAEVTDFFKKNNGYRLTFGDSFLDCARVIIATGGYASPSFGTDGAFLRLLKAKGYKTGKICPAVAPLRVSQEEVKGLKGVRAKGRISAVSEGKILRSETGEIQFTENSLSGICVFNLAYLYSQYEGKLTLRADLMPESSYEKLEEMIYCIQSARSNQPLEELLTGVFTKNLAVYLVKKALGRPLNERISTLKYNEVKAICSVMKKLEFKVTGASSWQNAQVTSGGIHGSCVDDKLESVLHRGVYFCGEILDTDGLCGGYNLEWAWSSGVFVGRNCAKSLKNGA